MIASAIRLSTRAVSAMVSPRPSWLVAASSTSGVPPSWRMAMSKLTRVRVEFFSNTVASTWPSSGLSGSGRAFGQPWRTALRSSASPIIAAMASPPASDRSRKWRRSVIGRRRETPRSLAQPLDAFRDVVLVDDQRRQHAEHVLPGRDREQPVVVAEVRDEVARDCRVLELDAEHQPLAADFLEQVIVVGNQLLECGAQPVAHAGDMVEEARL